MATSPLLAAGQMAATATATASSSSTAPLVPQPIHLVELLLGPQETVAVAVEAFVVRPSGDRRRRVVAVVGSAGGEAGVLLCRRNADALVVGHALGVGAAFAMRLAQDKASKGLALTLAFGADSVVVTAPLADLQPLLRELRVRAQDAKDRKLAGDFKWLANYRNQLDVANRAPYHVSTNPFILNDFSLNSSNSLIIKENWIASQHRAREQEFVTFDSIKIFTGTWNVNGQDPSEAIDSWLSKDADIYVLGFQELDLNTEIYLFSDDSKQKKWAELIEGYLGSLKAKFYKVASRQLIGMLILVYAKETNRRDIGEVATEAIGTGLMGFGNKGGVSCRFRFKDSYLCFVNAHLAADTNQVERRNQDYTDICKRTKYPLGGTYASVRDYLIHNPWVYTMIDMNSPVASTPASPSATNLLGIFDSDHLFFMGDLNYRIPLADSAAKLLLAENELERLFEYDQLNVEKRSLRVLQGFKESTITFQPTYKFDVGTNEYDTSEKKRSPSWCDRIFWFSNPYRKDYEQWIENLWYKSTMDLKMSDHKPVSAMFKAQIRTVDDSKKEALTEDLMKVLDKMENESLPRLEVEEDIVPFGDIKFLNATTRCVHVRNSGKVVAHFKFLGKGRDNLPAKSFYFMSPQSGTLYPGDVMKVNITILVRDVITCGKLNFGEETLDDVLILHTDLGKDAFISTEAVWLPTSFGNNLEVLCSVSKPIRFCGGVEGVKLVADHLKTSDGKGRESLDAKLVVSTELKEMVVSPEENSSIPKELWRLVDFIYRYGMDVDNLFRTPGDPFLVQYITECLDTGAEFDVEGLLLDFVDELEHFTAKGLNLDSASQEELHDSIATPANGGDTSIILDIDLLLKSTSTTSGGRPESPTKHGHVLKLSRRKGRIVAVHSMAECLFKFLDGLVVPVMTPTVFMWCVTEGYLDQLIAQQILAAIPPVHGHVFVYLVSFMKETLGAYNGSPELNLESLARLFAPFIVKKPPNVDVSFLKEVGGFGVDMRATMFVMQFLKGRVE
ncbi:Endonuclease/exonuclease/phosphatase [Obelidium mucronatum]|nr:Endonuclease/exonuclease/phosphatase [Obelidium mucronatum]